MNTDDKLGLVREEYSNVCGRIKKLKKEFDRLDKFITAIQETLSENKELMKYYSNQIKNVKKELNQATEFREVLGTLMNDLQEKVNADNGDMKYKDVVMQAQKLGISYIGKKREYLIAQIRLNELRKEFN